MNQLDDTVLERRLRTTLRAVAATVEPSPALAPQPRRPGRRGRRVLLGLGAVAVGVLLAAGALFGRGPEHVDRLPPDDVVVSGSVEGHRYWMVESLHRDACGDRYPGVEIVVEDRNRVGAEWDTTGYDYGEPRHTPGGICGFDRSRALANPALSYSGGTSVGDALLWVYAVHPDVTALRVTVRGETRTVRVHPRNGAGYAVVELPPGVSAYTVELLVDGRPVPGSRETRTLAAP